MEESQETIATNNETEMGNNFNDEDLDSLATYIESTFQFVNNSEHPTAQDCTIRHVKPSLFLENIRHYRPNYLVIGCLKQYHDFIEPMEWQKRIYLASFLKRSGNRASLNQLCKLIKHSAPKIRTCYEKVYYRMYDFDYKNTSQIELLSDDSFRWFIEMVLVDAAFIIELFLRVYYKEARPEKESDLVFDSSGKMHDIRQDLFLAHNQLPFFILKQIYEHAFASNPDFPSFVHLTCYFFHHYYNQNIALHDLMQPNQSHHVDFIAKLEDSKHFTDLLRTLQLPHSFQTNSGNGTSLFCRVPKFERIKGFVSSIRSSLFPSSENTELESGQVQGEYLYSATLLHEAGVKFRVSSSRCLLDIEFNRNAGAFTIPPLKLDEYTESFFRNLMCLEQNYYYSHETHICDYVFLMEYLIKSTEDVDLLVRKRIIINQLGSHTTAVTLFNNLCKQIPRTENNRYAKIFRELNAYNAVRRHSWIAILRLQYFSTPWTGAATVAAIVLLVLTLVQTICAIISL